VGRRYPDRRRARGARACLSMAVRVARPVGFAVVLLDKTQRAGMQWSASWAGTSGGARWPVACNSAELGDDWSSRRWHAHGALRVKAWRRRRRGRGLVGHVRLGVARCAQRCDGTTGSMEHCSCVREPRRSACKAGTRWQRGWQICGARRHAGRRDSRCRVTARGGSG
jgi:hypothetical protein